VAGCFGADWIIGAAQQRYIYAGLYYPDDGGLFDFVVGSLLLKGNARTRIWDEVGGESPEFRIAQPADDSLHFPVASFFVDLF